MLGTGESVIRKRNKWNAILLPSLYVAFLVMMMAAIGCLVGPTGKYAGGKPLVLRDDSLYSLPIMRVNVSKGKSKGTTASGGELRMGIDLKVDPRDRVLLQQYTPRIMDRITATMQRVELGEISEPSELGWLRNELLEEINRVSGPIQVLSVGFRNIVSL